MLIPTPHYAGFTACNHLEELTLQLAKEILEIQKDDSINTLNTKIIDITGSDTEEKQSINTTDWVGNLVNGVINVKNPFPNHDFVKGVADYPFNQSTLVNAFLHCAMYHQRMELSISKNTSSLQVIEFDIVNATSLGATSQLEISVTITGIPILIVNQSDQTIIKAKPYLA